METAWPFVGRDADVAVCREHIEAGRSMIVAGPAGIGKTQLAREIADMFETNRRVVRFAASLSAGLPLLELLGSDDMPLIVIDDVQSLDDDTAAVLGSVVASNDIVLLATMRTGTPAPAVITTLWKDDHATRLDLGPLTREQCDELLDAALGGPIDVATRRRLWELTQGSPLFVRELVRSSSEDGSLVCRDGMWRLVGPLRSERLDELILTRLDSLDDEARMLVDLVALGEPAPFELMLRNVDPSAFDAAEQSGLIEVVIDERRRDVRLVHPVFGDVACRHIGAGRTASLSRRLLEMIESTPIRRRDDIVRAATWQLRAGGSPVTDDMMLAARRALYDRNEWLAIELASRVPDAGRTDAVLVMSEAFTELGQPERAERLLRDHGGDLTDADRALIAIQRGVVSFWGLGDAGSAEAVLSEAESTITATVWRDEVRAERAVIAATQGHFLRALDIAGDLLAPTNPPRVFVTAAIAGAVAMAMDGRSVDAAKLAERALDVGGTLISQPGMSDPMIHLVARALALSEAGDLAGSEQLARVALSVSTSDGIRDGQAWFALVLGRTLLMMGRASESRALFMESAAAFAWLHSLGPRRWALAGVVQSSAMIGERDAAEAGWRELQSVVDHPARMMGVEVGRAEAWLDVARGEIDVAVSRLRALADTAFEAGAVSLGGGVLHDIVRLGGTTEHVGLEQLASAQGTLAPLRVDAVQAMSTRDPDSTEAVARRFVALGADLYGCEAFHRAGEFYGARGSARDAARCRRDAAATQRRTGEEWFVTLGLAEADRGERVVVDITEREREIAVLAVNGRTNREIADELYVSIRTVENHLQHVYEKLGVTSRRELPAALT